MHIRNVCTYVMYEEAILSAHKTRDECPARRSECSICKKMGHWATCCRQNKNLSTTLSQIRVLDILGKKKHRRAPRIKVHLHHNADDSFITTAQATPDTGAEATVAGLDILKQIGLDIGNTYHPLRTQLLLLMVYHSNALAQ